MCPRGRRCAAYYEDVGVRSIPLIPMWRWCQLSVFVARVALRWAHVSRPLGQIPAWDIVRGAVNDVVGVSAGVVQATGAPRSTQVIRVSIR